VFPSWLKPAIGFYRTHNSMLSQLIIYSDMYSNFCGNKLYWAGP